MALPRILIILVGVITTVSAVLADLVIPDLAAQHAFNPAWPPHAKFHDAQYMVMTVLLGLTGLTLALQRSRNTRGRLLCATTILATPWLGMIGALLFPDTATYDPEFANQTLFILGLHGQVFMAIALLLALLGAAAATLRTPPDRTTQRLSAPTEGATETRSTR
jgi:hypothetical protein